MPFGTGEGLTPFFFGLIARWKATVSLGKATFLPDCCRIELCCAICTETTCAPVLLISQWLESVPWRETEGVHTRTHAGRWGKITKTSLPSIGLCWLAYWRCSMLHPSAFPGRKRRMFARCNRVENNISSFDVYFPTTMILLLALKAWRHRNATPGQRVAVCMHRCNAKGHSGLIMDTRYTIMFVTNLPPGSEAELFACLFSRHI